MSAPSMLVPLAVPSMAGVLDLLDDPAGWRLTDSGQVVQQQVEGLRIRVLHGIVGALGEEAAGEFRSTVQALSEVLSDEGASSSSALPGP